MQLATLDLLSLVDSFFVVRECILIRTKSMMNLCFHSSARPCETVQYDRARGSNSFQSLKNVYELVVFVNKAVAKDVPQIVTDPFHKNLPSMTARPPA